jgi:hypothetical protein
MSSRTKRLRIPANLRVVVIGSVAFACSSTPSTGPSKDGGFLSDATDATHPPDGPRDASFDGGPCTIDAPAGNVCETTCYNVRANPIAPYACQVYCAPPNEGGPGNCSCGGGAPAVAGECPGGNNCQLTATDGGAEVFC